MKKLSIFLSLCFVLGISSCKKYLEQPPDNRTELDTPEKVSQLLATAYPQGSYMAFAESISDNAADRSTGAIRNTNRDPFFFEDVKDDQQDSPEYYWNACYSAIAAANHALAACNRASNPSAYSAQKGEALVARAYSHFMLVTFFSRYDSTAPAASSDPGIPYVLTPETEVFAKYERKTVQYVYEMIEKDLLEGLPLLVDQAYTVPKYHFTRTAAHAFATRFYLFKKDFAKVIEHADQVFPGNNFKPNLRPWNTEYLPLTFAELLGRYYKATEPANLLLAETTSWRGVGATTDAASSFAYNRYGMDAAIEAKLTGANVSGGTFSSYNQTYFSGNAYFTPKIFENFVSASLNSNTGRGYVMMPLFTAEEVLFNRAEANAKLGNTTASIADLNTYASTRIRTYNANTHNITPLKITNFYKTATTLADAVISTILDFKRTEYVHEGMRWFDLLRYKMPVTHKTTDGQTLVLTADDARRVFQIPNTAKLAGIELNPR